MTGRIRATNPQARREYVDAVTGARTRAGVPGSRRSGRLVTRVRPRADAPFEVLAIDPEDLDPARDTFGIDPATTKGLRERSRSQARGREPKPMRRDADLDLGRAGASTTFASGRAAADAFMRNNASFFDHPLFESTDPLDITRDFMDGIEVRSGKGHKRLADTPRGDEILGGGGRGHSAVAREMLVYLMGQAGGSRRWRDVPWMLVDSYVDRIAVAMQEEAKRQGRAAPSRGLTWYPLSSGVYQPEEVVALAVDELGEAKARKLAAWLNSQSLYETSDRLEHVLKPVKGAKGKTARRARKCLSKDDRATVRRRIREIREWAAFPEQVPSWACVSSRETESTSVPVCMYPALEDEIRRLLAACDVPYDSDWPTREHARLCASGSTDTSGLPPQPCPGDHDDDDEEFESPVDDELDLPWENPRRRHNPLQFAKVNEYGVRFESGVPVTFEFMRNTERSPYFGSTYQQDIEPAGRYVLHQPPSSVQQAPWEFGTTTFRKPLVLAFSSGNETRYDERSWKAQLQKAYGKTGKALSRALQKDGYDGIVTVEMSRSGKPLGTSEIVDLRVVKNPRKKNPSPRATTMTRRLGRL